LPLPGIELSSPGRPTRSQSYPAYRTSKIVFIFIKLVSPFSRALIEKLVSQLLKKYPVIYVTVKFSDMLTRDRYCILSRARLIKSTSVNEC
jgi:hypothetical protein